VIAPVVGAFAEMSPDTYAIADLISSVLANEHCSFEYENYHSPNHTHLCGRVSLF
jgi:hypothetical protein